MSDDARRLAHSLIEQIGTVRETAFDSIVFTTAQLFRAPVAVLTLVGDDRVWRKAYVGPVGAESPRDGSVCDLFARLGELLVVEDATADARFAGLDLVIGPPQMRFCAGAPLFGPGNLVVGALCVLDRQPRSVPERQRTQLAQLANEASDLLRLRVPDDFE